MLHSAELECARSHDLDLACSQADPDHSAMHIWTGTSGFSYKEWKGQFYPAKLPAHAMLAHYAGQLPAVEINNTFYRLPKPEQLAKWAGQVPESFRFSIKASRRITHFKKLGASSVDETNYLLETCAALGSRLGAILFQLPPTLTKNMARLAAFTERIPNGTPAAFEFRHPSWFDNEVRGLLHDQDFALVHADVDEPRSELLNAQLPEGTWGYLRMRRLGYSPAELEQWVARVGRQGWQDTFVFFKHEDEAAGPKMAKDFLRRATRARKDAWQPEFGMTQQRNNR